MKITIIFPARAVETARATTLVMPLAPTLLAALAGDGHQVRIVDMFAGDEVDYNEDVDLVAITVRTPLAVVAYAIADRFLSQGKTVVLGGPHTFALPREAKTHATAVAIGEGEKLWPLVLQDAERKQLKDYYVSGPYELSNKLDGEIRHEPQRPSLAGLPMMRRDLLPRERYFMDSIFTTRGCPNACKFCPVTPIFGGRIRHRPIDEVVAEVETLGERYYNVDDSVFGHPQIVDRRDENQYYLDLFRELAKLRPKRRWTGAGGIAAISYPDGRRMLELAAESGLSSIAAGLESISGAGQRDSGAWRKLHCTSSDAFDLQQMKDNIRAIQSLGIEIRGFFIIGWDDDTPDTYRRTLELCDECNVVPFIFTLTPMPGSRLYDEYLEQGRILPDYGWDAYGGSEVVYKHPRMSPEQMRRLSAEVMEQGYSATRIARRTAQHLWHSRSPEAAITSALTQLGIRRGYRQLFATGKKDQPSTWSIPKRARMLLRGALDRARAAATRR